MDKFTLPQFLRYLLIGFILIGVHYICFPKNAVNFYEELGKVGTPIFAFVAGSITFLFYRSTIYGIIILRIIDKIHPDNVRNILISRYDIPSWYKAEVFWQVLQQAEFKEKLKNVDLGSAGTHSLYMASIAGFVATIILFVKSGSDTKFWIVLGSSLILTISAFISDYYIETIETLLLKSIGTERIDEFAQMMEFKKKTSENGASADAKKAHR